jgi:hypothetical protein
VRKLVKLKNLFVENEGRHNEEWMCQRSRLLGLRQVGVLLKKKKRNGERVRVLPLRNRIEKKRDSFPEIELDMT